MDLKSIWYDKLFIKYLYSLFRNNGPDINSRSLMVYNTNYCYLLNFIHHLSLLILILTVSAFLELRNIEQLLFYCFLYLGQLHSLEEEILFVHLHFALLSVGKCCSHNSLNLDFHLPIKIFLLGQHWNFWLPTTLLKLRLLKMNHLFLWM